MISECPLISKCALLLVALLSLCHGCVTRLQASVASLKPIIRHISFPNCVPLFWGNSICLHERLDCVSAPTHGDAAYGNVLSYLEKLSLLCACEMLEIRLCRYCDSVKGAGLILNITRV